MCILQMQHLWNLPEILVTEFSLFNVLVKYEMKTEWWNKGAAEKQSFVHIIQKVEVVHIFLTKSPNAPKHTS